MGSCCSRKKSDEAELPDPVLPQNDQSQTVLPAQPQVTLEVPPPETLEASITAEPKDLIRMGDREGELKPCPYGSVYM